MLTDEVSRSEAATKLYLRIAKRLFKQAQRELGIETLEQFAHVPRIVEWFLASDYRWAPATIRQYRAAMREVLERLVRKRPDNALCRVALDSLNSTDGPEPSAQVDRKTSALKRRSLTPDEAAAIDTVLAASPHRYAVLARGLLRYGVELGLRPCEWVHARMDGSRLVVINAKSTNGRGNGLSRDLDLGAFAPSYADDVTAFLKAIADAIAKEPWEKIYPKIRYVLAAASRKAATKVPSLRRGVFSPYTGRCVASARAKRVMDRASVAALLGHATDRTASTHYPRPHSARHWHPVAVAVDPAQVATVQAKFRAKGKPRRRPDATAPASPQP